MRHGLRGLGAGLLAMAIATAGRAAAPAQDPPPPATQANTIHAEQWLRRPVAEDMLRVYPPRAKAEGVKGKANLACGVTVQGRLADCVISSETPADYGFGAAALRLAPYFRLNATAADGTPTAGATINVPIVFDWY